MTINFKSLVVAGLAGCQLIPAACSAPAKKKCNAEQEKLWNPNLFEELYGLVNDTAELNNLSESGVKRKYKDPNKSKNYKQINKYDINLFAP